MIYFVLMSGLLLTSRADQEILIPCETTDFCLQYNSYYECLPVKNSTVVEPDKLGKLPTKLCYHKDLWPLYPKEWVGTMVFALFMCVANLSGIGGGGIAIPMLIYFFELEFKQSVAVSSFSILISSLARFFFNLRERHPEKPGCVTIDYNVATVMMPLTLVGSLIGAYIFQTFPELYIMIIMTLMLVILTWESSRKYLQLRKKENEAIQKETELQSKSNQVSIAPTLA